MGRRSDSLFDDVEELEREEDIDHEEGISQYDQIMNIFNASDIEYEEHTISKNKNALVLENGIVFKFDGSGGLLSIDKEDLDV